MGKDMEILSQAKVTSLSCILSYKVSILKMDFITADSLKNPRAFHIILLD